MWFGGDWLKLRAGKTPRHAIPDPAHVRLARIASCSKTQNCSPPSRHGTLYWKHGNILFKVPIKILARLRVPGEAPSPARGCVTSIRPVHRDLRAGTSPGPEGSTSRAPQGPPAPHQLPGTLLKAVISPCIRVTSLTAGTCVAQPHPAAPPGGPPMCSPAAHHHIVTQTLLYSTSGG